MKPGSFLLIIAALFLLTFNSLAQLVEPYDARKIAAITLSELRKGSDAGTITGDSVIYDSLNQPLLYIFNESKGGFIILSADKRSYPLLGWSESGQSENDLSEMPPAMKEMISCWTDQISFIRENDLSAMADATKMWQRLESGEFAEYGGTKDVLPLLATKWSQGCGYNAMCPVDPTGPCGRAFTGCVATAMAQVIRHREHPVSGTGSKCYTSSRYGELCADFSGSTYDYAAMSNTGGNSAVAKLMYHCGVSVSMNYGPSSSGAFSGSVATAMRTYFDYTNGLIISKGAYPEENWENILISEMENNRPVYYSGYGSSGHAFVLDGYKETNHFHVNWGWGGSYDGYFYLSSLNPGSMNFTSGQQGIIGMIPSGEFAGLNFVSAIGLDCKTPVTGNLSEGTDYVNYYKNIYPATPGREMVYIFTSTLPGRIRIKITNQSQPVYTFLLNYANKDSVLTYGTNGLVADDTKPGTYYVVVESQDFSEPEFTIEAICPTFEADLDIISAAINPQYVQSLQSNVAFTSRVRNIGKTSSPLCLMEYYLSSDASFDPGSDIRLGDAPVPSLTPGDGSVINSVITMPDSLLPGYYYVMFIADRENIVPEADDENLYPVYVTVPDSGILDCSSSISLADSVWHYGNTLSDGTNRVEKYSTGWDLTGPEVIHTFTSQYNGIARISFMEKSPGMLYALVLPVCNENTVETNLRIYKLTDTLSTDEFYVVAGIQYFLVIDGSKGASGDYGVLIDLPGECPLIKVEYWGKTDLCEGDQWPGFWTNWGHSNYQWYRNGTLISGATTASYTSTSTGAYHVEITENGCTGSSVPINVRMDPRPDTARISSLGDNAFCEGGSVTLKLDNSLTFPVNWAKNEELIASATGSNYSADETGSYSLFTVNGVCRVKSENSIEVSVFEPPADIDEALPFPSERIRFYCTFDEENSYEGGVTQKFTMTGWDYEPVDDRFGNFWKARYLMGEDEMLYWSDYDTISEDFTLALWFKTTTLTGGVISGFFDSPWGPAKMEAFLYMSDNGKLHFWISNGGTPEELITASSYNDGSWHYVMIQHDGEMILEMDDGAEKIISSGPATKEIFKGYWTFGGPVLPAGVSDMPASKYFSGAIDDILCLDEANEYTTSYMVRQPMLNVLLTDALPSCVPASISFRIPFSQKGVGYRVWDRIRSLWAPVSAVGDGGDVQFGGAEVVLGSNEFAIIARDLSTGCETVLDTVITVEAWSVCTLQPEDHVAPGLKVYPVPANEILYFESDRLISEIRIFDAGGRIVHASNPCRYIFGIDISHISNGVYYYRLETEADLIISGKVIIQN